VRTERLAYAIDAAGRRRGVGQLLRRSIVGSIPLEEVEFGELEGRREEIGDMSGRKQRNSRFLQQKAAAATRRAVERVVNSTIFFQ
jgi:hypothetical protein